MPLNSDPQNDALTEQIIGCIYAVSNELGCGFLESVYENAMVVALRQAGVRVEQQVRFKVLFRGVMVGEFIADLVVEGRVLVELKAVKNLDDIHTAQCINMLRVTRLPICLLVNFAKPRVELKRYVGKGTTASIPLWALRNSPTNKSANALREAY